MPKTAVHTKRHRGSVSVPYKVADPQPLTIMWKAWASLIDPIEPENWYHWFHETMGDLAGPMMHTLDVWIEDDFPSLFPSEYRFARVAVSGDWIDYDGTPHKFVPDESVSFGKAEGEK